MPVCKDCEHYNVCLIHCSESVLRNRGICEHFKNGWISVKDRLPGTDQTVLYIPANNPRKVVIGRITAIGKCGGVCFTPCISDHECNFYAKYWMPLPEPPKEGER